MTQRDEGRRHPSFSLPIFQAPTGKLQFRIDGAASAEVMGRGTVKRGEVVSIGNPEFAERLADGGQFAHVTADTPIGIPETTPAPAQTIGNTDNDRSED